MVECSFPPCYCRAPCQASSTLILGNVLLPLCSQLCGHTSSFAFLLLVSFVVVAVDVIAGVASLCICISVHCWLAQPITGVVGVGLPQLEL